MLELSEPPAAEDAASPSPSSDRVARARIDRMLFARRDAGDLHAREELVERFLPLARSLARRYEHSAEPLEDLIQVASLALVKAVDRYQLSRGCAFSSFAVPTIVGELKRHFRDRSWAVRPPRDLQELTLRVDNVAARLSEQLDRTPTVAELASTIGCSEERVLEAMQARGARGALSLQALASDHSEQSALQETLGFDEEGYACAETRVLLDGLLMGVAPRSREILRLRFEQDLTQAEIGARIGVSQMQVSRIIRQTVGQLRQIADDQQAEPDRREATQPSLA